MKYESSSGGLVVFKSKSGWMVLIIKDMKSCWTFPKGLIEPDENQVNAAAREIVEETGITGLTPLTDLGTIKYNYKQNDLIQKTVFYFLFESKSKQFPEPQFKEGITEGKWVRLKDASEIIGYPKTNKLLLQKAEEYLKYYAA